MNVPFIIGGPSGVGKSCFCRFLQEKGWLYLEADHDKKDGIDELGIRAPWDAFLNDRHNQPLAEELSNRMALGGNSGVVLALPSRAVPTPGHLSQPEGVLRIRFLYGDPRFCRASFLAREKETGRGLDENHWDTNNCKAFEILSTSPYHPYLVDVFDAEGSRLPWNDVLMRINPDKSLE